MAFIGIPESMTWPLLAALVLTGIHVYFGIHVIGRKVIFVDLALAQIAALGVAFGVFMGYETEHSPGHLYGYSLAFTIVAALVFSITKRKSQEIPHEAIIGITYAVAVAVTMIVLAKSPLGPQEFDRMMKGQLLWVKEGQVLTAAGIYAAIGVFHFLFRKKFYALSFGGGSEEIRHRWLWDFLFYASFGFVVTSSVSMAGVFLVFCLLVIPSVGALLFAKRTRTRLAIGWIGGGLLCVAGIQISWSTGWPTSPVSVVAFAGALLFASLVRYVLKAPSRGRALLHIVAFGLLFSLFGGGLYFFRNRGEDPFEKAIHLAHAEESGQKLTALNVFDTHPDRVGEWLPSVRDLLKDGDPNVRLQAMKLLVSKRVEEALSDLLPLLRDPDDHVREECADLLHEFGDPSVSSSLILAGDEEGEPDIRVHMYEVALEFGDKRAVDRLLALLDDENFPRRRREKAYKVLSPHIDYSFGPVQLDGVRAWWKKNREALVWARKNGQDMFTIQ
ncbi:MAG: metal ABC transporter permease [Planctomycetota bacterium]|nr:metal ABC transporter permease [Planctomycetota bacterium]